MNMAEPLQDDLAGQMGSTRDKIIAAMRKGEDCKQFKDILSQKPDLREDLDLFHMCVQFYSAGVEPLLDEFLSLEDPYYRYHLLNKQDAHGNTALHYAVIYVHWDLCVRLVDHGAKRNMKNSDGFTPLILVMDIEERHAVPRSVVDKLVCKEQFPNGSDENPWVDFFIKRWIEFGGQRVVDVKTLKERAMLNSRTDEERERWEKNWKAGSKIELPDEFGPTDPVEKPSILTQMRDACGDSRDCVCIIL